MVKEEALADEVRSVDDGEAEPAASRKRVREAIERNDTAPVGSSEDAHVHQRFAPDVANGERAYKSSRGKDRSPGESRHSIASAE